MTSLIKGAELGPTGQLSSRAIPEAAAARRSRPADEEIEADVEEFAMALVFDGADLERT